MSIVPQEPILFQGSIRSNLDPFSLFNDEQLWNALGKVHLSQFVASLPGGTGYASGDLNEKIISDKGSNLSVGQRQLLCLGKT